MTLATGIITLNDLTDGYSIHLTNEAHTIVSDADGNVAAGEIGSSGKAITTVIGYKGGVALTGVVGTPGANQFKIEIITQECTGGTGVATASGFYLDTITSAATLSGKIVVKIWLEGVTTFIKKEFTWSKSIAGVGGLTFILLNDTQSMPCTSGRVTTGAFNVTIPFAAYLGATRIAVTAALGTLPSGVTLSSNTAGTSGADGTIVLAVASGANFGGTTAAYDIGTIDITLTANSVPAVKKFGWSKSIAGTTARTYFCQPNVSILSKNVSSTISPATLIFSSYYKDGTSSTKTAYARYWKIETTTDGSTWSSYATKTDATVTTYSVTTSSLPANTTGVRATIYSDAALTSAHDTQSVMVVLDGSTGKTFVLNIEGGVHSIKYDAAGSSPSPSTTVASGYTAKLYEDGVLLTSGVTYAWTAAGVLASSLDGVNRPTTNQLYEPLISSFFIGDNSYVQVTATYGSNSIISTVPVSVTYDSGGLDWVNDWSSTSTIVGGQRIIAPRIFVGKNDSTTEVPDLTGIALGKDVMAGTESNNVIGMVVYKHNQAVMEINSGYDSNKPMVSIGLAGKKQITIDADGNAVIPNISANQVTTGIISSAGGLNSIDLDTGAFSLAGGKITGDANGNIEFNYSDTSIESALAGKASAELESYVKITDGTIELKANDPNNPNTPIALKIDNDSMGFYQSSDTVPVAEFSNNALTVTDGSFTNTLKVGTFAFIPRSNGNLSFRKV